MIKFTAAAGPTGRLLRDLLIERGLKLARDGQEDAVVSYGVRIHSQLPCLNARAGELNKYAQLERLREKGISVPPFSRTGENLKFPLLGRKFHHVGGKDIVPILGKDVEWPARQRQSDFFTQYIPRQREYRVWAFRRTVKAVYEKVLKHPEQLGKRVGANYDNGFAFDIAPGTPEALRAIGAKAVDALGLDFGAENILQGFDGAYYVLEVNTAPGVEGPRQGLTGLADSIAKWVRNGYPKRNGEGKGQ